MPVAGQRYEAKADLTRLHDHPRNPRVGDDASVATSIDRNGWYGAIIAQESSRLILAGHTRRRALTAAGQTHGPVLWVDCDEETALRILLTDNRTAELATWNDSELLELLHEIDPDDLAAAGFTVEDVEVLQRHIDTVNAGSMDYSQEWERAGMPDYASEDMNAAFQTTIAFRTVEDADAFFREIDRPKSRRSWWPEPDGFVGLLADASVTAAEVE